MVRRNMIRKMFIAPSYVSVSVAEDIARKAEEKLFSAASARGVNAFIKNLSRNGKEYGASVVVESDDAQLVENLIHEVESRTVHKGLKIIRFFKDELKSF